MSRYFGYEGFRPSLIVQAYEHHCGVKIAAVAKPKAIRAVATDRASCDEVSWREQAASSDRNVVRIEYATRTNIKRLTIVYF
jgi:hypothetical protein